MHTQAGSDRGVYWGMTSSSFPPLFSMSSGSVNSGEKRNTGRSSTHPSGKNNTSKDGLRELKVTKLVQVHQNVPTRGGRDAAN